MKVIASFVRSGGSAFSRAIPRGVLAVFFGALATFASGCPATPQSTTSPVATLPVLLKSLTLVSYDTTFASLIAQGTLATADATPLTVVRFYNNGNCTAPTIGAGTASTFAAAGIPLKVSSAIPTAVYVQTNTDSFCSLMTTYQPVHIAPPAATFIGTVPVSPSHVSYSPIVFGSVSSSTSRVTLYDNLTCTHPVGTGAGQTFSTTGIAVTLSPNTTSSIYDITQEPFGNSSPCTALTTYTHSVNTPGAPGFASISPLSPSNSSVTPTVLGTLSTTSVSVALYSDSGCQTQLASGSKNDFTVTGMPVTVAANATTAIYAQAADSAGDLTGCTYLTTFVNTTVAPAAPGFTFVNPVTPTRLTIYPLVVGTAAPGTAVVRLFNSAACTTQIGSGTVAQFTGTGVQASVIGNAKTTIFAEDVDAAGNASACTHLIDFVNDTIPPDPPSFSQTNPVSPNNKSYTPLVQGTTDTKTVSVKLYNDQTCHTLIGLGTTATFAGAGISVTTAINAATSIYGQSIDNVGNVSDCTFLTSYAYSNLAAPPPTFVSTSPASPSNNSTQPFILGTAPSTVSSVALYLDATCSTAIVGHGSRVTFSTVGIQATVPANTNSSISAISTDVYGNTSSCVPLTTYLHDNILPTAPTFTATSPVSPNNQSGTPSVTGTAANNPLSLLPTNKVTFYDSPSCVNNLGSGLPTDFSGTGIVANVYPNSDTSIYARTSDAAGNQSACTYLTDYIYDTLAPGKPQFAAANPASPSYSLTTLVSGTLGTNHDIEPASTVSIYSEPTCLTTPIGTGSSNTFTSSGIVVTTPENATTKFYGQTTDLVGNVSACNLLTTFQEADNGPTGFGASMNPDGSVNVTWIPDPIAQPVPTYIVQRSLWSGGPYTVIAQGVNGNAFRDTSVTNGATYYYVVQATNSTGTSHLSTESSVTINMTTSGPPTLLVAIPGPAQVTLDWAGTSPIMNYSVYRSLTRAGPYTSIATGVPTTTYTDTGLTGGTSYFYVVSGVNPAGESVFSNEASAVPQSVPSAPGGLVVTPVQSLAQCSGNPGVVINWGYTNYFQQFNVKRSTGTGSEATHATVSGSPYYDCNPSYNTQQFPNGTPNFYVVTATWGLQESSPSNESAFVNGQAPSVSSSPGNGIGVISWSAPTTAVSYTLSRSSKAGGPYTVLQSGLTSTSYVDSTVTNGTTYYYVVSAYYPNGYPGWPSQEVNLTPGPNPNAPTNLDLTVSSNQPVLNWTPSSAYDSFNVYRASTSGGTYALLSTVTSPNFQDSAPLLGMNWYKVTTLWGSTETSATNTVSFRNGVPGSVVATSGATSIGLTWGTVASISHYNVLRSTTAGGPYTSIATPATASYTDTSATVGTGYFYVITASFADGTTGQYSTQVSGTAGATVPSGLTAILTSGSSVTLQWAAVPGATSYRVYDATLLAGPYVYTGLFGTPTSQTVAGLTANKTYYFEVTAVVGGVESAKSAALAAYTAGAPSSPLLTPGNAQIALSWAPVTGATSYNVLRSTDSVNYAAVASGLTSTTYTDSAVTNGSLYFYKIAAVFPSVTLTSLASTGATPGITPLAPAGLTVVSNTDGTDVTLSWGGVPGASNYNIYESTTSGGPYGAAVGNTSSSSGNTVSGLTAGTTYYFVVTALIGSVESAVSPQISVIPSVTPPAPSVVAGAGTTAIVSWTAVAGATNYDVRRSTDGVFFTKIASAVAATTYSDSGLTAGASYFYEYQPRSAAAVPLAISAPSSPVTPGIAALPPSTLGADAVSATSVNLAWVQSSNAVTYNVYRGSATGGPYTLLGSVPSTSTTYVDNTVTAGNGYYYVATTVNASGVESGYSNEASVTTLSAPTGLAATAADNQIGLSWTALAGASTYTVKRSFAMTGPFGVVASGVATPAYTDTQVVAGTVYYYEVAAVMGSGLITPDSSVVSATGIVTVNLQVPIELTDEALGSGPATQPFLRTQTTFNPNDYDGTDSYYFEINATNSDTFAHNVTVIDTNSAVVATISVPASTALPTRLRASMVPDAGLMTYQVSLDGTPSTGQLQVLSARLLVNQIGATKTKLYIPLITSALPASSGDASSPATSTANTSYLPLTNAAIYNRNTSVLKNLASYNAWALETVTGSLTGSTGYVGLYNTTLGTELLDTQTDVTSSTPEISNSPFDEGITGFAAPANEGNNYELGLVCVTNCTAGTVSVYKAGLWVTLNTLTQAEIVFRESLKASTVASTTVIDLERTMIDLTLFSNPTGYFQSVVTVGASGSAVMSLQSAGVSDSSTTVGTVTGSTLSFSGSAKARARTASPITLTTGNRYLPQVAPGGGATPSVLDTSIIIDVTH